MPEGKRFGPYKGSAKNGGREIYVYKKKGKDGKWHTTSSDAARVEYKEKTGKKLNKKQEVDHKDNNKHNNSSSNLRVLSKSKNVAKENKRRAGKKENQK